MIRQKISFLLFIVFFLCPAHAKIDTIYSFDEAKETLANADNKTVVVFDIDEVLTTKENPIFQERYANQSVVLEFEKSLNQQPSQVIFDIRKKIFLDAEKLIEPKIVDIIKKLQKKNVCVFALTSRLTGNYGSLKNLQDISYMSLKGLEIDFSPSFPIKDPYICDGDLLFYKGIGFVPRKTDGSEKKDKGVVLMELLGKANIMPNHIIFFDDNPFNLEKIENAIIQYNKKNEENKTGINPIMFSGFLYCGVAKLPDEFDEKIAKFQADELLGSRTLLSQEEAKQFIIDEKQEKNENDFDSVLKIFQDECNRLHL